MASVTSGQEFLEEEGEAFTRTPGREIHLAPLDVPFDVPASRLAGLGRGFLGDVSGGEVVAVKSESPPIAAQHAELVKTAWTRRGVVEALQIEGQAVRPQKVRGRWVLVPVKETDPLTIPWSRLPSAQVRSPVAILGSDNSKMQCPSFDLPAGPLTPLYGSCPGSFYGQSTSLKGPPQIEAGTVARGGKEQPVERLVVLTAAGKPVRLPGTGERVNLREAICQTCYATGAQFALYTTKQRDMMMLYLWTRAMMGAPETYREWITILTDAIQSTRRDSCEPDLGIRPVRVHSSGDFFNKTYATAWIEVANALAATKSKLPFVLWAPTRTWAAGEEWIEFWKAAFDPAVGVPTPDGRRVHVEDPSSFIVRPSAYHFGDPAPAPGQLGGPAAGTTAIWDADRESNGDAGRYDWFCRAYATGSKATCVEAIGPDAQGRPSKSKGCRACWVHPHLRIAYAGH